MNDGGILVQAQNILSELTDDTYQEVNEYLIPLFNINPKMVFRSLFHTAKFHFSIIPLLVNIVNDNIQYVKLFIKVAKKELKTIHFYHYYGALNYFIYKCYESHLLSIDDIISIYSFICTAPFHTDIILCFGLWFAPEISSVSPNQFSRFLTQVYRIQDPKLRPISRILNHLHEDNWSLLKKVRTQKYSLDLIANAIKNDDVDELKSLTASPHFNYNSTLTSTIFDPCWLMVNSLTLIEAAAVYSSINCFKFLLISKANIHTDNMIECAVFGGSIEILRLLQFERTLDNAASFAARYHRPAIFNWLYKPGDDLLFDAVSSDNSDAVLICLQKGVDPNDISLNETPLQMAVRLDHLACVETLSNWPSTDINQVVNGLSALHLAVRMGRKHAVEILIKQSRTDLNVRGKHGETPLHIAAEQGFQKIATTLIADKRTNSTIKDNSGNTPSMVAMYSQHQNVLRVVRSVQLPSVRTTGLLRPVTAIHIRPKSRTQSEQSRFPVRPKTTTARKRKPLLPLK